LSWLNLSPGSYSLHVGLYHPDTKESLPVPGWPKAEVWLMEIGIENKDFHDTLRLRNYEQGFEKEQKANEIYSNADIWLCYRNYTYRLYLACMPARV
jgi:hypothetical protein